MTNDLIDPKPLRTFLIDRKMKALDAEKRSNGMLKVSLGAQIQVIDALLIYLASQMEEKDMGELKLRLGNPIPTTELKKKVREGEELRTFLIEASKKVSEGDARPIDDLGDLKAASLASKMWAMREKGILPAHIVPLLQTETVVDEKTKKESRITRFYIAHKTPEELAKMRKGKSSIRRESANN